MKIIIDISEQYYNAICNDFSKVHSFAFKLGSAIKKGVVLPKEHGRLVDANVVNKNLDYDEKWIINDVPTVIEADHFAGVSKMI